MMDQGNLRKADIFSGTLIFFLGVFIVVQALKMPMKDSWGGVQNVWYVSPALFPLFVGAMLSLLGFILILVAFKSVGTEGLQKTWAYLSGAGARTFLVSDANIRFYAIVVNLFSFVFLMVPRVDFFLASVYFLLILFFMFYLGSQRQLFMLLCYTVLANLLLAILLFSGIGNALQNWSTFPADWFVLTAIAVLSIISMGFAESAEEKRKYRLCLSTGILAPVIIGIIFKYLLLVPMPFEGLIVALLDAVWYADFWS